MRIAVIGAGSWGTTDWGSPVAIRSRRPAVGAGTGGRRRHYPATTSTHYSCPGPGWRRDCGPPERSRRRQRCRAPGYRLPISCDPYGGDGGGRWSKAPARSQSAYPGDGARRLAADRRTGRTLPGSAVAWRSRGELCPGGLPARPDGCRRSLARPQGSGGGATGVFKRYFRVDPQPMTRWVQLGGALKNVIAIAAGI